MLLELLADICAGVGGPTRNTDRKPTIQSGYHKLGKHLAKPMSPI